MNQQTTSAHPLAVLHSLLGGVLDEGERLRDAIGMIGFGSDEALGELFDDLTGVLFTVKTGRNLIDPDEYDGELRDDLAEALDRLGQAQQKERAHGRGDGRRVRLTLIEGSAPAPAPAPAPDGERANHPGIERAILGLLLAQDGLAEYAASAHPGHTCTEEEGRDCPGCEADCLSHDAAGGLYVTERLLRSLESCVVAYPPALTRLQDAAEDQGGYYLPDAERIAAAVLQLAAEDAAEEEAAADVPALPVAALVPAAEPPPAPLKRTWAWEPGA